ncbi:aldo/keto reductase [Bengtsoniella intestinalis]|uniref:aldo/keto reductase n=1 Tax=Bengtsoniella intestinalis TaxID=3073143 RepID=UPI00391F8540
MEKRILGNSGIAVSPIAIGCWSFGGGAYWGEQSQKDVDAVVNMALDNQVNLFDCAEVYNDGDSELSLGKALKGRRDEAVIITKQVITPDQDDTIARFEASLKRLDTDFVDVMMIHWPTNDRALMERTLTRYQQLVDAGKVKAIGISNFGVKQMTMVKELGFTSCVNELHYNIASRAIEHEIIPMCQDHGMGVLTYVSLQQGVLTGKYQSFADIPPRQARYRHYDVCRSQGMHDHKGSGAEAELTALLSVLDGVAKEQNVTIMEVVLGWALRQQGITSAIVGCRNLEQLSDNLKGGSFVMDDATCDLLTKASQPIYEKLGTCADYLFPVDQCRVI